MALPRTLLVASAAILSVAGCQDPTDPCDRPDACEVHGVDLYISRLQIVATRFDSITGFAIVAPDPIIIDVAVHNRGDSISSPATLLLQHVWAPDDSVAIPPLRPGDTYNSRVELDTRDSHTEYRYALDDTSAATADTSSVSAELLVADANTANNRKVSPTFHVAVPMIEVFLESLETDIWVNAPFNVRLRVANRSRHAELAPRAVGFELVAWPQRDAGGRTAFGTHDIPPVPPLGEHAPDLILTVPSTAAWQDVAHEYLIVPLTATAGATDSMVFRGLTLGHGDTVTVHPDYRACEPAVLQPDTVVWSSLICDIWSSIYVFELQARPGHVYGIEQPGMLYPGATIRTPEGVTWGNAFPGMQLQFAEPGTYWVVDYWGGGRYDRPPARAMRLLEWPVPPSSDEG